MKHLIKKVGLLLILSLVIAGCRNTTQEADEPAEDAAIVVDINQFPIVVSNQEPPIEGGVMEVAIVTDTQFVGLFLPALNTDFFDRSFMSPANEGLFSFDEDFLITNDGVVALDFDQEAKQATLTIQKEAAWSDGEPLKAADIIYAYEIIGHPDYTGVRYDTHQRNIVGIEEYHAGEADSISGIEEIDEKTVRITYQEVSPTMLQSGGGIWGTAEPKHHLGDIPIKELESSDQVRKTPLHFGPYAMSNVVPGESVELIPNEHYYGSQPHLEKIVINSVPQATIVEALRAKSYDLVISMPPDVYPTYQELPGYEILGREDLAYTYFGFKLGTWDEETSEVNYDPQSKMASRELRQAMMYALDLDLVSERFYYGIRTRATSLIIPTFGSVHNDQLAGYPQDQEKARQLLAEAGYVDVTGDGYVEDPDGAPLTINFLIREGGETAQPLADYYIQEWAEIGLRVELSGGRLADFNAMYDKIRNDDPDIDIFDAAWSTGTDPSPTSFYSRQANFNFSRYASEEHDQLLADIDSAESFDVGHRKAAFDKWQAFAEAEAYVVPSLFRNALMPVHERVTGWDWQHINRDGINWVNVGLSSETRD